MKKLLIISILIFTIPVFAFSSSAQNFGFTKHIVFTSIQDSSVTSDSGISKSSLQDSTRTNENVLKLKKANPFFIRNMMMLSLKNSLEFNLSPFSSPLNRQNLNGFQSQGIINSSISNYLMSMRSQNAQHSLGLFGKILGYAQSAAATFLLYQHVSKYGLGFDRPKKERTK